MEENLFNIINICQNLNRVRIEVERRLIKNIIIHVYFCESVILCFSILIFKEFTSCVSIYTHYTLLIM